MKPVRTKGSRQIPVNVNDVLSHPFATLDSGAGRNRWKYKFLRVTRLPTMDRPESGRVLVENAVTGKRTEHYAFLFGVGFINDR